MITPAASRTAIEGILGEFEKQNTGAEADSDLAEDMAAWRELSRDIAGHIGKNAPLDQFLQELQGVRRIEVGDRMIAGVQIRQPAHERPDAAAQHREDLRANH